MNHSGSLIPTRQRFLIVFKHLILLSFLFVVSDAGMAQIPKSSSVDRDSASIRAVLAAQVEAWNSARLEAFMDGYWKSEELTFFSGGNRLKGWDATLERYRKSYQSAGREMGKLSFNDLHVQTFDSKSGVVRGRFELVMSDGSKPTGLFTLIFQRFSDGWKIIHDHTSTN